VNSLAAWSMVCGKGGLCTINPHLQNNDLLLKHLERFYNNADVPWVKLVRDAYYHDTVPHVVTISGSFWWRGVLGLVDVWITMIICKVVSGSSALFWNDKWQQNLLSAMSSVFLC
jgi:hypothetical protein